MTIYFFNKRKLSWLIFDSISSKWNLINGLAGQVAEAAEWTPSYCSVSPCVCFAKVSIRITVNVPYAIIQTEVITLKSPGTFNFITVHNLIGYCYLVIVNIGIDTNV